MKRTKPLSSYKRTEPLDTSPPFKDRLPRPGSRLRNHDPLEDALEREKILQARVEELEDEVESLKDDIDDLKDELNALESWANDM